MATFHHQLLFACPIEKVFAVVADATTHPQWQAGLIRTDAKKGSAERVGAKGVEVRRMFGREMEFPYEITVYDPPRAWGFRATSGPIRPAATLTFSRHDGETLVQSELTVPGLLGTLV